MELIQELFLDIPNFDEFLDIMRFEECSASDDLSHLLRDVTLLGDSPKSTDGEDEEVVEVFLNKAHLTLFHPQSFQMD